MAVQGIRLRDVVVYGTGPRSGIFNVRADVTPAIEPESDA